MIKRLTSRLLLMFLCALGTQTTFAQEAFFAQYYASPMHLNPAMVGVFDGQYRLNANFRQQWGNTFSSNPFRTTQAAFEYRARVMKSDFFGFGINALSDFKSN
jgi:Type IX secretion system membrane protein PorP/SprF